MMRHWRAISILGLIPVIAAAEPGINQVTGARFWSYSGSTRVIIEVSGEFEYKSDRATTPDRLFFDIVGARPLIDGKRIATKPVNDSLVKRLRIAETAPGTTRVVFDLESAADFTVTKLDTPDRLVVELRPAGGAMISETLKSSLIFQPPMSVFVAKAREPLFPAPPPVIPVKPPPTYYLPDPMRTLVFTAPKTRPAQVRAYLTPEPSLLPRTSVKASSGSLKASSQSLTRALGLKINRVVIDAGHGGHDVGTLGPNGAREKDVVLDVAQRVAKLIQERLGAEVVMTRDDDTFIPLQERTTIANRYKADLFLSIHANSSPAPQVAGTETFYLNFTSNQSALDVASRENAGAEKSVGELKDLIQSITLNDKLQESRMFAEEIERSISANAAKNNAVARDRGIKRAPFVVLIGAQMPSVLAEIGFLSNVRDEKNLMKPEYRQKVAEALFKGVSQYSQSLSHFETSGSGAGEPGGKQRIATRMN